MVAQITSPSSHRIAVASDPNGNHDSGYVASHVEDTIDRSVSTPPPLPGSPRPTIGSSSSSGGTTVAAIGGTVVVGADGSHQTIRSNLSRRNGGMDGSPKKEPFR